jgi:flagellar hook-associated protein 3 FlgL
MTERITNVIAANTMIANINDDLALVDNSQNELSTGLAIQQPSDDPYGAALSLQLDGQVSAIKGYQTNVTDGLSWSETASASLQSIYQMGQTVQTLVVEGSNGTEQQNDLNDMAEQVSQMIDGIKQAADTQLNGMYIFSGTATDTEPYATGTGSSDTYNGNTGTLTRSIGPGPESQVTINADLSSVLGNGGSDGLMLSTLNTIEGDLTSGNTTDLGTQLTNLQNNLASLANLQAQIGATQDRVQMATTRLQSLATTDQTELGGVQDVNMATATIQYSTEQAGYQAALQVGGNLISQSLLNFLKD